jgi:hypothetical protein
MATAPRISYFDGSGSTTNLVVTTNLFSLFLSGTVDPNTVDVQVDVNGSGFVSDPTLVGLIVPDFSVPNPVSFPNGLQLEKGVNVIRLRAIDLSGGVSPVSTATITVASDVDLQQIFAPPTGVQLRRRATTVDITWAENGFTPPAGFNVYASTGPAGTGSGYLRVNADMVPASTPVGTSVDEFPIETQTYDFVNLDGTGLNSADLRILTETVDPVTQEVIEQKSLNFASLIGAPGYRFSYTVTSLFETKKYLFNHDRGASVGSGILNNDTFSVVALDAPLYYVVTAVYFDKANGILQESRYSTEMSGFPLALNSLIRGVRIRDQKQITQDYIGEIQKSSPELALIPGSTVREVHIEPFANEVQKAYFLADFVHRAKSFPALLAIDDPGLTGTSIPVTQSAYKTNLKTALSTNDDAAVQVFIDSSFDSLALNFDVKRGGFRPSTVVQTFYTTTKPVKDLIVQQGAVVTSSTTPTAPRFISRGQVTLPALTASAYYNPDKRRYELKVQMVAESPGANGNVPANSLDIVSSGAKGLSTVNEVAADFGQDLDSNLTVAENAMRALSSLDTGTSGGYAQTAALTPGVFESRIVRSGDPYMMRDWDPVRQKHIGGKVDIYVKGTNERTEVETFAFQFSVANNVRFDVIDPAGLIFRARDSRLTQSNPIQEMLFNPSQGLGLRNHSNFPTTSYDLTGVVILDYRTIQLSTLIPQPITLLDDFVEGDYRFRSNNRFVGSLQPVRRVTSVVGEISGALDSALGYTLFKSQDPLLDGESTIATDYVEINQVGSRPSGSAIQVNDERHVLIGEFVESMNSVGVNEFTLQVFSKDRTILYNGPSSASPDYLVISGTQTVPLKIIRASASAIQSGSTVSVDYEHDENFSVTYVVNDVLQQLQKKVDKMKHVTADVLVKQAVENPMSTEATIQLLANADQAGVDANVRTAVSVLTDKKGIGQPIYQTDVSSSMKGVTGVDFIVQPFTKMTLQTGAIRVRDSFPSDSTFLPTISAYANAVYIMTQALPFNTVDGGGGATVHHGVYMDNLIMEAAQSLNAVGLGAYRSWIIGSQGAVIPGYSDDATLTPVYVTPSAVAAARLVLTANKVVVSVNDGLSPPDVPENHSFAATYIVSNDKGSKDIQVSSVEYLTPGDLTLTWRAAT